MSLLKAESIYKPFNYPWAYEAWHMQQRIHAAYQADHDVKAVISADGRVTHAQVVAVIDLLRREKVTKFAINTSPLEIKEAK